MAEITIDMKAEDVNRAIADAIVRSTLGETINRMVNEYVKSISVSYDNPIKRIIEAEGQILIRQMILDRRDQIQAAVTAQLSEAVTDRLIATAIERLLR